MRDELVNETLFFTTRQAREVLAYWVHDDTTERPHPSPGRTTPAALAAGLNQQQPRLIPAVAPPALPRNTPQPPSPAE